MKARSGQGCADNVPNALFMIILLFAYDLQFQEFLDPTISRNLSEQHTVEAPVNAVYALG